MNLINGHWSVKRVFESSNFYVEKVPIFAFSDLSGDLFAHHMIDKDIYI